jgi:Icc-related predicted phosphoesterase
LEDAGTAAQLKVSIAVMADTHGYTLRDVPIADVVIHSGDACAKGTIEEFRKFSEWFDSLPHRHKIFVPGNHDRCVEVDPRTAERLMPNVTFLTGRSVEVAGLTIWGGPWTPGDGRWAYNSRSAVEARDLWGAIESRVDVVVTHGPPRGILDGFTHGWRPMRAGCRELRRAIVANRPQLHVFGHIHECGGRSRVVRGVRYLNAAVVDSKYRLVRGASVVNLEIPRA